MLRPVGGDQCGLVGEVPDMGSSPFSLSASSPKRIMAHVLKRPCSHWLRLRHQLFGSGPYALQIRPGDSQGRLADGGPLPLEAPSRRQRVLPQSGALGVPATEQGRAHASRYYVAYECLCGHSGTRKYMPGDRFWTPSPRSCAQRLCCHRCGAEVYSIYDWEALDGHWYRVWKPGHWVRTRTRGQWHRVWKWSHWWAYTAGGWLLGNSETWVSRDHFDVWASTHGGWREDDE